MKYCVLDTSGKLPHAELVAYAAAQQRQLREHYAGCYDGDGDQDEVRVDTAAKPDEIAVRLEPHAPADQEGALGYHDLGVIHVFLDLATQSSTSWTSICSHEVLEQRADPRLHDCIELDDGSIWDKEVCDRVEADSYKIDGVELSNFNTPQCFSPPPNWHQIHGLKFDWLGLSKKPNEVRPGGYAQRFDLKKGWTQVGAMRQYRAELAARGLSRNAKRELRRSRP